MWKLIGEGLTFDDVLLIPSRTNTLPEDINLKTNLTKKIVINSPIMSAAMDSVTESKMAIALARQGGIGIIHRNMSIEEQVLEVDKVKRSENGVVTDPFFLSPNHYVYEANELMAKYRISGVPITENDKLVGIITNRDLRFEPDHNKKIYEVMTKENIITILEGTSMEEAIKVLTLNKLEKLPIVDEKYTLKGLITIKDIQKTIKYPASTKDINGRLMVGASVGVYDGYIERITSLLEAKVDVIVLDSLLSHSDKVVSAVKNIKNQFPNLQLIVGNVSTAEATLELIEAGADAIKVGIGPGSICTTRVIAGVGVPQITAIYNCSEVANKYGVPVIADGGIKFSGDITKAIAAGASVVMMGKLFAGCEESPAKVEIRKGRKYKLYRGIGSVSALQYESDGLYFQGNSKKIIPDGIEGIIPYDGTVPEIIYQLLGGLKTGMSYLGCNSIDELKENVKFIKVTSIGLKENHPDEIKSANDSPNYSFDH
jgi:IMP dehydrogenase